jgi:hypothetical protein
MAIQNTTKNGISFQHNVVQISVSKPPQKKKNQKERPLQCLLIYQLKICQNLNGYSKHD